MGRVILTAVFLSSWIASSVGASTADSLYHFTIDRGWLRMPDGVRLSVTYFRPVPKVPGESFPALLELLPYRKDDSFYARDYPLYSYFARHGLLMAKVDIRGTGGSEGRLPWREYSEQELDDGVEIIHQLARLPGSNGSVGMWGISWGGFNAIQVVMRRPPELKAILALHASDDLYHDDVRYIDGVLHIDPYALQIDHENALPRTPDYPLDSAYFRDRFEADPWILTYLTHPTDGEFWRKNGLRFNYAAIQVPCYLIGGLLDGYRDTPLRMLEQMRVPLKVEIGPWVHDWPDNGTPGPNYEWRARAVLWWNHWLRGADTDLLREPRLTVFVRDGHPPDDRRTMTPGRWRMEDWPIQRTRWDTWRPGTDHTLTRGDSAGLPSTDSLSYIPGSGTVAGDWWGEPTGDMSTDDASSLVYDSPALTDTVEIIGFPRVRLRVTADAELANWSVRLEDVNPDGRISLVTGAAINGTERASTLTPEPLVPGQDYDLSFSLHFTTWTYHPGHRIRLAISNAQFPMLWPSPRLKVSTLQVGTNGTALELPSIPFETRPVPDLPVPELREPRPDYREIEGFAIPVSRVVHDGHAHTTSVEWSEGWAYKIGATGIQNREREFYQTSNDQSAESRFDGDESHRIRQTSGAIELRTAIRIVSDDSLFHVLFTRTIFRNGRKIRERKWKATIPRQFH